MSTSSVLAVVLRVIDVLEELSIPYHLGGSFASTIHGVPRQTGDVDIVVDIAAATGRWLAASLTGDFYVDENAVADAVARKSSFNAIHLETGFKVDFFVVGPSQYDRVELERSVRIKIVPDPPRWVFVKSAEDILLRKLQWYQLGGEVSDRQWRDLIGVLKAQKDQLDRPYLDKWARQLGLSALLRKALSAAAE